MKQGVCAAYIRGELKRDLLLGPPLLAGSGVFYWASRALGLTEDLRMWPLLFPIFMLLFSGGFCLLYNGLRILGRVESSDLYKMTRRELSLEEERLPGKDVLAMLERDLSKAVPFAGGKILIGKEWLFVSNDWGKPVLRLEHLRQVKSRKTKDGRVILKFMDAYGTGPATREIPAAEAGAIQALLQRNDAITP